MKMPALLGGTPAFASEVPISQPTLPHPDVVIPDFERALKSKQLTNGDYVREYPPQHPGEEDFRIFALDFDAAVYGGALCDRRVYEHMNNTFEQMVSDVHKRQ